MEDLSNAQLWYDGSRGIYIPMLFAQEIDRNYIDPSLYDTLDRLAQGPDYDEYWENWEEVLNQVRLPINGKSAYLYQDGGLWLVPTEEG